MKQLNIRNFIVTIFISNCFLFLFWFYFYKKILYNHRDWINIINKKNYPNQYFNNDKLQKILNYQEKYTKQLEYFREFNLLTKILFLIVNLIIIILSMVLKFGITFKKFQIIQILIFYYQDIIQ